MKKSLNQESKNRVFGYLRISTNKQDLTNQQFAIMEYCVKNKLQVHQFISVEMSSRKSEKDRRITELLEVLRPGDTLITVELSRLGRNMLELLSLINDLNKRQIKIIFIKQPELSTNNTHSNLLLSIYSYFCETERNLISMRVKDSLERLKSEGKKLGREKGIRNKVNELNNYITIIEKYINLGLTVTNILKIINSDREKKFSYTQLDYFLRNINQIKHK